jgi:hypothetical protein
MTLAILARPTHRALSSPAARSRWPGAGCAGLPKRSKPPQPRSVTRRSAGATSPDNTSKGLHRYGWLEVTSNAENAGFASGSNQGDAAARHEIVVFLNNDTVLAPGWARRPGRAVQRCRHRRDRPSVELRVRPAAGRGNPLSTGPDGRHAPLRSSLACRPPRSAQRRCDPTDLIVLAASANLARKLPLPRALEWSARLRQAGRHHVRGRARRTQARAGQHLPDTAGLPRLRPRDGLRHHRRDRIAVL